MIGRSLHRILLASLVVALCSCGGAVKNVKTDLSRVERNVADLRNFQAEQTTQLSSLQKQLRRLQGRVEQLEYEQRNLRRANAEALLDGQQSSEAVGQPAASGGVPPIIPAKQLAADEEYSATLPERYGKRFSQALLRLQQGDFVSAVPLLEALYDESYGEPWAPHVLFWIGVGYDGMGEARKALKSYHEVATKHTKSELAPLSLLKQGSVFIRLNDADTARLTYQKLLADYPRTAEANIARERLKDLPR